MIELEIDTKVVARLQQAFPKPPNSAKRALEKYVKQLTEQLNNCEVTGRSKEQIEQEIYFISMKTLRNYGGQIGPNKIRLQNWFEQNKLNLFVVKEIGSNLSEKLTQIKLTKLVTVHRKDIPMINHETQTDSEIAKLREELAQDNQQLFDSNFPGLKDMETEQIKSLYDFAPIDERSLKNYIRWLKNGATLMDEDERVKQIKRAEKILRLSQHAEGYLPQRKKASAYGRVYYEGISVQNVSKELREAMLGHSYEYDLKSAVFTWKMCYAAEVAKQIDPHKSVKEIFKQTIFYLTDKAEFLSYVRYMTFHADSNVPRELQDKLLKQAMTAISFGARLNASSWREGKERKYSAIADIIQNPAERLRFINCDLFKEFIAEQCLLDEHIFKIGKSQKAEFFGDADVRTASGRLSKSKVIAFLYQSYETELMDVICELLQAKGKTVIARIHDAIITEHKISLDDREEILYLLRDETNNPYWRMSHKEIKPFIYDSHLPIESDSVDSNSIMDWFKKVVAA